jgi:glycosyltransferase involved in cell wall biosynthesis
MLVESSPMRQGSRDIDLLWVGNIKHVKRPDRILELARALPGAKIHVIGGEDRIEQELFKKLASALSHCSNVVFHGRLPYADTNRIYDRARLLVSTSDIEGFPNVYLQAWVRGIPVVTLIDPDGVIALHGLGVCASSFSQMPKAIDALLNDELAWSAASERCRAFMKKEYGEEKVLREYLEAFEWVTAPPVPAHSLFGASEGHGQNAIPHYYRHRR